MDIDSIVTLINSCGFPIVVSGALFWFIVKQNNVLDKLTNTIVELKTLIEERLGE